MEGTVFAHKYKIVEGALVGGAIVAATDIPASGSYVDVSGTLRTHIVCKLGVIHASDAPTLQPKCSDAVGGTADAITGLAAHTVAADDDTEFVTWTIETSQLPTDHHFLLIDVGGTTSNGSYADINFFLEYGDQPVTQISTTLPSTSQYYL